ncbi:MAG: hypothetical protein M1820_001476 [Bogoriella megaspora]|nr:MAG: hypothetical protein M1820_001476 [Bogoriella megaspora]
MAQFLSLPPELQVMICRYVVVHPHRALAIQPFPDPVEPYVYDRLRLGQSITLSDEDDADDVDQRNSTEPAPPGDDAEGRNSTNSTDLGDNGLNCLATQPAVTRVDRNLRRLILPIFYRENEFRDYRIPHTQAKLKGMTGNHRPRRHPDHHSMLISWLISIGAENRENLRQVWVDVSVPDVGLEWQSLEAYIHLPTFNPFRLKQLSTIENILPNLKVDDPLRILWKTLTAIDSDDDYDEAYAEAYDQVYYEAMRDQFKTCNILSRRFLRQPEVV